MRIFILADFFSGLKDWYVYGDSPKGMPAVFNFFKILGKKDDVYFNAILYNKYINRTIIFENGSKIILKKITLFKSLHLLWKFNIYILTFYYSFAKIRKEKYDVIYGMSVFAPFSKILGKFFKIKSVGRVFGTLSAELAKNKKYFKLYTRHIIDLITIKYPCDILISTEDGTDYSYFSKRYNPTKQVEILYNGIEMEFKNKLLASYNPNKIVTPNEFKIIYIGRLSDWKRQDLAIDTLWQLRKMGMNASLTLVGDGPNLNKLKKQISKLNLNADIDIIFGIPQDELPKLIAEHDISMFLYNNGNLGNALWESCLAGQLICIRNSGDLKGIFINNENSIVVNINDTSKDIANSIMKGLNNSSANDFGSRIQEKVNLLIDDWEERIEKELKLFK